MPADIVYDVILGSNTVRQVTRSDFSAQLEAVIGMASGAVDPAEIFGGKAEPQITFETSDLSGFLAALSVTSGLLVSSGTITVPYAKRAQGGSFAGAGANWRLNATNGLIVPTQISCNQDDDAALATAMIHLFSTDGFTAPVTSSSSQNLASQSFTGQYTLGPAKINGSALAEVTGITVNPGIEVLVERHNGANYPTKLYIVSRRPTIDITFAHFDSIPGILFTAMTSAEVFFRKRSGVGFTAETSEAHVKFSFGDGLILPQTLGGAGTQTGEATVRLHGETLSASAAAAIVEGD